MAHPKKAHMKEHEKKKTAGHEATCKAAKEPHGMKKEHEHKKGHKK